MTSIRFSIAIGTFRRNKYLRDLLADCANQANKDGKITHEILVCDNDSERSAQELVEHCRSSGMRSLRYFCVEERNISHVRNKLIEEARGEAIIFLDDDQRVDNNFLQSVETFWTKWSANLAGAKFRVLPIFEKAKPTWLRQANFFSWPSPPEGEPISQLSTNGCIFSTELLKRQENQFDPSYGRSGGGDTELFLRLKNRGGLFLSADSVVVFERISPSRESFRFLIKRNFHQNTTYGRFVLKGYLGGGSSCLNFIQLISKFLASFLLLLVAPFAGKVAFSKVLLMFIRQAGKVVGFLGLRFKFY